MKLSQEEFESFESVRYWMDSLPGRDGVHTTKYGWKLRVRKFCEWLGKTPDQIIEERREHLKSSDPKVQRQYEMHVKRFLRFLEEEGLSPNARRGYYAGIRNFFARNFLELKFMRGDGPRMETVSEGCRAASKDDVKRMAEVSSPRVKALILFIKDTGLSESDVAKLKLKDLSNIREVGELFKLEPPIPIITRRKKTGALTSTFLGKEGFEALKISLRLRIQGSPDIAIRYYGVGREVKGGIQPEELTLESPLFRSYGKILHPQEKGKALHLIPFSIGMIIRKAAIRAGIYQRGFSAHALRRFFQTTLEASGISHNWVQIMMGHKLNGVEGSYSQPTIEMLREAYAKAYPNLSITEESEHRTRIEWLESQMEMLLLNGKRKDEEIQRLRSRVEERVPTTELEDMKHELAELKAALKQLLAAPKP